MSNRTEFKIFPNPVEDILQVIFPNEIDSAHSLYLIF